MLPLIQALECFLADQDPLPAEQEHIRTQQERLRRVASEFWRTDDLFLCDALGRGTAIRPITEAEVLLVLNGPACEAAARSSGPGAMLTDFWNRVQEAYSGTKLTLEVRSVRLELPDIPLRVFPGFLRYKAGFIIPDREREEWIPIRPDKQFEFIRQAAQFSGGLGLPIARALKVWSRHRATGLEPYHVEVLALRALTSQQPDLFAALQKGLAGLGNGVKRPCPAPGLPGEVLDPDLDDATRERVSQQAEQDLKLLQRAAELQQTRPEVALGHVRQVLGEEFSLV